MKKRPNGHGSTYYRKVILRADPCAFCATFDNPTLEHIHPRTHGGINNWSNYANACVRCNNKKGNVSLLGFMLNRAGLLSRKQAARIGSKKRGKRPKFDQTWNCMPEKWFDPLGIMCEYAGKDHATPRW
jgi:hypothetical protein